MSEKILLNGEMGKRNCWLIRNKDGHVLNVWLASEFQMSALPYGCSVQKSTIEESVRLINDGEVAR